MMEKESLFKTVGYESPSLKAVELKTRAVLCQSGGIDPMTRKEDVELIIE